MTTMTAMTAMAADPPRKRRSSFSENIQRVFHVDRSDKRRPTLAPNGKPSQAPGTPVNVDSHDPKPEANSPGTPGHSGLDETGVSSFSYSSYNSRKPSLGTPDSSASVHPVTSKDEGHFPDQMAPAEVKDQNVEHDHVGTSPTWRKDTTRKERRATQRLEAERKELEKRLLRLEESQARLDQGIYERQSRRLSKKQPLGSSSRSSSANTERPRSSSLSALFSRSRRGSRSRASSAHGSDRDRRSSDDFRFGPPSLPLVLPERFGTAVSRELANRHGTGLGQLHYLPPFKAQSANHSLHSSHKSDDLRESWKMAEAWQKQHGNADLSSVTSNQLQFIAAGNRPWTEMPNHRKDQPNSLAAMQRDAELDRERFTTALRQNKRASNPMPSVQLQSNSASRMMVLPLQHNTPADGIQQAHGSPPPRVHPVDGMLNVQGSPGPSVISPPPEMSGNLANAYSKAYKSSPLAMNPNTTIPPHRVNEITTPWTASQRDANQVSIPKPLRIFRQPRSQYGENRERFGSSVPSYLPAPNQPRQNAIQAPPNSCLDAKQQQIPQEAKRPPRVIPPPKNPRRRSTSVDRTKSIENESPNNSSLVNAAGNGSPEHVSPQPSAHADSNTCTKLNGPGHLRSQSDQSSRASSYNTADEEVLDVPADRNSRHKHQVPETSCPVSLNVPDVSQEKTVNQNIKPVNFPSIPSLAPDGPLSLQKKNAMQRARVPRKDEVVAKAFVICCQCKYWHDMPSEVYARLACPARLPSDSRFARTFSRRNSVKKALFPPNTKVTRRFPVPRQQTSNDPRGVPTHSDAGASAPPTSQPPALLNSQCCWCGHGMGNSCCQGWSTLVSMRERFH
ncbi:hypothetical protein N7468_006335 [Penicillium chermesinum]|uniref:Uncharacterized protein n=1 Tax=Penicillium chermesinum TaxID=63820 RepID=A0A9W9TL13_9EURO|nr:uncharacterized protein N7468_006335 [Penicillium chermesinum]KAJ5225110.1 hypothetical protein N7468_006335 [Penicillium chermesinum]KAJ6151839.1 hypothetical protein N7470_006967 [Penicillium chermesinum]